MKLRHLDIRPPRVEMMPLIDIVFLLLVVFIYTMLSMAVHKGMPVDLPAGKQVQTEKEALVSITVTAGGAVFVDKAPVAVDTLGAAIMNLPAIDSETAVLLFADRDVAYRHLFRVLEQLRRVGLHRISLQVESEEP